MPFNIPASVLTAWQLRNEPRATAQDVQMIEGAAGTPLPAPYVEFITTHGFVVFGLDAPRHRRFSYSLAAPGQASVFNEAISYLHNPPDVVQAYRILAQAVPPTEEFLPAFPADYLPVGNDFGQGQLLLELRPKPGRVWYWPEREFKWGTGDNTELGFVAENFYDFINQLQPDPL